MPGIQVDSVPAGCVIAIANAAPGDSVSGIWTITNTTGAPYQLSVKATTSSSNHLKQDLRMGIWDITGPPPGTLPLLTDWLPAFNALTTLNPGQSVQLEVQLFLPTTAGNADQGNSVVIALLWQAQG